MAPVRYDTLAARVRLHLMDDPRISSEAEADAEINLMSNVELVETISHVLWVRELEGDEAEPVASAARYP